MKIYKKLATVAMAAFAAVSLTGCDFLAELLDELLDDGGEDTEYVDAWANLVKEDVYDAILDIKTRTLTYGTHSYTIVKEIDLETQEFKEPTASVTFTHIPSGYTEFSAVYENLLGKSIAGTAAMIPMAMEIYARDAKTGEACFDLLCSSSSTVSGIIRQLKDKFVPTSYSGEDDSYIQRFIPAALLKGANPDNAYSPSTPYTVEMTMSPNGVQEAELSGGVVIYLYILTSGGWDSYQRGVEILLPYDKEDSELEDEFEVFNCPSCYTQCKPIKGTWAGLK
ncbi:MAG: hypothetical protein GXY24_06090 [Bacteroidales bacterium]|nr:hypothetical protein [Bacteroidales bacterium]